MNSRCHAYELRQIGAWTDGDGGWNWNESWHLEPVQLAENTEKEYLLSLIQNEFRSLYEIEHDGNLYELVETKSHRPLFALVPTET